MRKKICLAVASILVALNSIAQVQLSYAENPLGGNWESSVSFSVQGSGTIPDDWYIDIPYTTSLGQLTVISPAWQTDFAITNSTDNTYFRISKGSVTRILTGGENISIGFKVSSPTVTYGAITFATSTSSFDFSGAGSTNPNGSTTIDASEIWKADDQNKVYLQEDFITSFVGIGTNDPKEKLQLGSEVFFHDGGDKMFTRNCYWDYENGGDLRIADGYVSCFRFSGNGGFNFTVDDYGLAGTPVNNGFSAFRILPDGKIGLNNATPTSMFEVGKVTDQTSTDPNAVTTQLNGLTSITANVGGGNDVLRLNHPDLTSNGRNHYMFFANRKFSNGTLFSTIGAYDSEPGSTTAAQEGPKTLILQPQTAGGNLGIGYHNRIPVDKLSVKGGAYFQEKVAIGIGSDQIPATYMLAVNGGIIAKRVKVAIPGTDDWSDYVFASDYKLKSLEEVETFVKANKHLPGVPSAEEVVKDGYDIAKMDATLLEKIEELTLYMIEMKKQNEALKKEVELLKQ